MLGVMEKIFVIARAKAVVGKEKEAEAVLKAMVAPTLAELGCEIYDLYSAEEPGLFYFFERWESREALQAHTQTPHYLKLGEAKKGLVEIVVDKIVPVA